LPWADVAQGYALLALRHKSPENIVALSAHAGRLSLQPSANRHKLSAFRHVLKGTQRVPNRPFGDLIDRVARARSDHRERHRPTGFGFALADSVDYLDAAQWDGLTASQSRFLQRPYLRVLEQFGPSNVRQRYALVFRGRQPVAALAAQLATITADTLVKDDSPAAARSAKPSLQEVMDPIARKVRGRALGQVRADVLICGNLFSWGLHGAAFAKGEDSSALWPAVAEAVYRLRRAERLASRVDFTIVKDVPDPDADGSRALERFSYQPFDTDPDMVLDLAPEWRTYDDYLSGLNAKYRKAAVRTLKEVEQAGYTLEQMTDLEAHAARLHELYRQVHERATLRLVMLPAGFFPALAAALPGQFRCGAIRRGDELAGFVTTLKDKDTAVGYYLGYDTAANASVPIYLRLLHAVVADALALGCRRLSLGRTALEPKARLGARPEPLRIWLRHRQPVFNWLVRPLLGLVPVDEVPERNPFK